MADDKPEDIADDRVSDPVNTGGTDTPSDLEALSGSDTFRFKDGKNGSHEPDESENLRTAEIAGIVDSVIQYKTPKDEGAADVEEEPIDQEALAEQEAKNARVLAENRRRFKAEQANGTPQDDVPEDGSLPPFLKTEADSTDPLEQNAQPKTEKPEPLVLGQENRVDDTTPAAEDTTLEEPAKPEKLVLNASDRVNDAPSAEDLADIFMADEARAQLDDKYLDEVKAILSNTIQRLYKVPKDEADALTTETLQSMAQKGFNPLKNDLAAFAEKIMRDESPEDFLASIGATDKESLLASLADTLGNTYGLGSFQAASAAQAVYRQLVVPHKPSIHLHDDSNYLFEDSDGNLSPRVDPAKAQQEIQDFAEFTRTLAGKSKDEAIEALREYLKEPDNDENDGEAVNRSAKYLYDQLISNGIMEIVDGKLKNSAHIKAAPAAPTAPAKPSTPVTPADATASEPDETDSNPADVKRGKITVATAPAPEAEEKPEPKNAEPDPTPEDSSPDEPDEENSEDAADPVSDDFDPSEGPQGYIFYNKLFGKPANPEISKAIFEGLSKRNIFQMDGKTGISIVNPESTKPTITKDKDGKDVTTPAQPQALSMHKTPKGITSQFVGPKGSYDANWAVTNAHAILEAHARTADGSPPKPFVITISDATEEERRLMKAAFESLRDVYETHYGLDFSYDAKTEAIDLDIGVRNKARAGLTRKTANEKALVAAAIKDLAIFTPDKEPISAKQKEKADEKYAEARAVLVNEEEGVNIPEDVEAAIESYKFISEEIGSIASVIRDFDNTSTEKLSETYKACDEIRKLISAQGEIFVEDILPNLEEYTEKMKELVDDPRIKAYLESKKDDISLTYGEDAKKEIAAVIKKLPDLNAKIEKVLEVLESRGIDVEALKQQNEYNEGDPEDPEVDEDNLEDPEADEDETSEQVQAQEPVAYTPEVPKRVQNIRQHVEETYNNAAAVSAGKKKPIPGKRYELAGYLKALSKAIVQKNQEIIQQNAISPVKLKGPESGEVRKAYNEIDDKTAPIESMSFEDEKMCSLRELALFGFKNATGREATNSDMEFIRSQVDTLKEHGVTDEIAETIMKRNMGRRPQVA